MIRNERAWSDFFLTWLGLILFTGVLLLAAFFVAPLFAGKEPEGALDAAASGLAGVIEAVDTSSIPVPHYYTPPENAEIDLTSNYVTARSGGLLHAEPVVVRMYPSNAFWDTPPVLRQYLDNHFGDSGDEYRPINASLRYDVHGMFTDIRTELAAHPYKVNGSVPLKIEKVIIFYTDRRAEDYVVIYQ